MRKTEHFNLNLVEGSDLVNPLVQDVPNYEAIDQQMYENMVGGISGASELKVGNVHNITRLVPDCSVLRFTATSDFKIGDVFTVDGMQVTAKLPNGENLGDGAFVINSEVLCVLVGTLLTVFVPSGKVANASDSDKLGGKEPSYYASADDMGVVRTIAEGAGGIANEALGMLTPEHIVASNLPFEGTLFAHKIGNLVVGFFHLGTVKPVTANAPITLAKGLPRPLTYNNASISICGHQNYGNDGYSVNANIDYMGNLYVYPSKTGNYGFTINFCYVCE